MSAIIFILTFQPIIDYLKTQEKHGILLNGHKIITLPYTDDFCLITGNNATQQRLISEIHKHITSMGMTLKPSKCHTFSIKAGTPTNLTFKIGENTIPFIEDAEQKFLGKVIFFSGKEKETLSYLSDLFNEN